MPEPWLRATLTHIEPIQRQVLHALELTREDAARWTTGLTFEQLDARPYNLPPLAFHLRHIARSLDRLLTYAEGRQLDESQRHDLATELDPLTSRAGLFAEFSAGLTSAETRIRALDPATYAELRGVGRKQLPTTVGGLLVHCAEHTQRHTGQFVTTAKIVIV